ncbi:PREDICTED: zinc finger protein 341-like [Priapulus caudatus]|uniref:Zinc finger protein 341-like n=1 Tax=Priapulus caudatus TaxID=37621 RepID=A0ABM1E655_PRICU|nr:PREDICTED: zinc finger protein 341-like [Priapulus caudatus]
MAQALFEALTGGVSMDTQTALAVHSLLEYQGGAPGGAPEAVLVEEEDVFQCGKCKKQFTSLTVFMAHKREHCNQVAPRSMLPATSVTTASAFAMTQLPQQQQQQPVASRAAVAPPLVSPTSSSLSLYNALPTSPLAQIAQSMVIGTEELVTFATIDQTGGAGAPLQNGVGLQAMTNQNPFMPQTSPVARTLATASSVVAPPSSAVYTSTFPLSQPQAQTILSIGTPIRPSPSKGARRDGQAGGGGVLMNLDATKGRRRGMDADSASNHKAMKLRCTYCEKLFSKNFDLQQHIRSHTGEKPFQCIVCGRAFAQKSNVKKHMQSHKVWPSGMGRTLPMAPLVLMSKEDSKEMEEQTEGPLHGHTEEIQISSLAEGQEEMQQNCKEDRTQNMDPNCVVVDASYLCQYCNQSFENYFHLKTHMVSHKSEQVYKCVLKTCSETFHEMDQFLDHVKMHEDELSYRCHMCSKSFSTLYDLGVHQYSHSLYPNQQAKLCGPRYYRCNKCMNKYATPEALEHHMNTVNHTYPCPQCGKVFPCERYLRRHLPLHGTLPKFLCQVCNKGFKTDTYLKMHALIHTNERPFACDQCPAAFNRKDKLKRHKLIHLPQKRFKCPFRSHVGCKKEFSRADKLKAHIITHSGIKPFKCADCGKMFSRKMYLKEHERTHQEAPPWRCDSCERGFFRHRQLQLHKCRAAREEKDAPMRTRVRAKLGRPKKRAYAFGVAKAAGGEPRPRGRPRKHPLPAKSGGGDEYAPLTTETTETKDGRGTHEIADVVFTEQQLEQAGIDPYAVPDGGAISLQPVSLSS